MCDAHQVVHVVVCNCELFACLNVNNRSKCNTWQSAILAPACHYHFQIGIAGMVLRLSQHKHPHETLEMTYNICPFLFLVSQWALLSQSKMATYIPVLERIKNSKATPMVIAEQPWVHASLLLVPNCRLIEILSQVLHHKLSRRNEAPSKKPYQ